MAEYTVQDLQDNLNYINETKSQIKQAIIDKGQVVEDSATFRSYVDKIKAIETGIKTEDATATSDDIIAPKTAYVNGEKVVGTITTETEVSTNLDTEYSLSNVPAYTGSKINDYEITNRLYVVNNTTSFAIGRYTNTQLLSPAKTYNSSVLDTSLYNIRISDIKFSKVQEDDCVKLFISCKSCTSSSTSYPPLNEIYLLKLDKETLEIIKIYRTTYNNYLDGFFTQEGSLVVHPLKDYAVAIFLGTANGNQVRYMASYYNATNDTFTATLTNTRSCNGNTYCRGYCTNEGQVSIWTGNTANLGFKINDDNTCSHNFYSTSGIRYYTNNGTYIQGTNLYANNGTLIKSITPTGLNKGSKVQLLGNLFIYTDNTSASATCNVRIADTSSSDFVLLDTLFQQRNSHIFTDNTSVIIGDAANSIITIYKVSDVIVTGINYKSTNYYSGLKSTATSADVLLGKTAIARGTNIVGTMPNNGTKIITPGTQDQTIALGYHTGEGYVKGSTNLRPEYIKEGIKIFDIRGTLPEATDTDDATAIADDIIAPKTAYIKGEKVTGRIEGTRDVLTPVLEPDSVTYTTAQTDVDLQNLITLRYDSNNVYIYDIINGSVSTSPKFTINKSNFGNKNIIRAVLAGVHEDYYVKFWVRAQTGTSNLQINLVWVDEDGNIAKNVVMNDSSWQGDSYTSGTGDIIRANPYGNIDVLFYTHPTTNNGACCNIKVYKYNVATDSIQQVYSTRQWSMSSSASFITASWSPDGYVSCIYVSGSSKNCIVLKPTDELFSAFTLEYKGIPSPTVFAVGDNHYVKNNILYEGSTQIATLDLSIATNYNCFVYEGYFCIIASNVLHIYNRLTGDKLGTIDNIAQLINVHGLAILKGSGAIYYFLGLNETETYTSLSRLGITYFNTEDATATSDDIAAGKTAYSGGELVTGNVTDTSAIGIGPDTVTADDEKEQVSLSYTFPNSILLRKGGTLSIGTSYSKLAETMSITSDQIVSGNTVLGIEGTYKSNIKIFNSLEELQSDTSGVLDDFAMVISSSINKTTADSRMHIIRALKDITLSTTITDTHTISVGDEAQTADSIFVITLTPTECTFVHQSTDTTVYRWVSEDGLTYTGTLGSDQTWGELDLVYHGTWNDAFGEFVCTEDYTTTDLYRRSLDGWYKILTTEAEATEEQVTEQAEVLETQTTSLQELEEIIDSKL